MLKNSENNGTGQISLVTPTPGPTGLRVSRWAIGGGWLQSPASQDDDGGKSDIRWGHYLPCYRDEIFGIRADIGYT